MEFLNFNRIFWNWNEKYMFYQKLCETKIVDLFEMQFKYVDLLVENNFVW